MNPYNNPGGGQRPVKPPSLDPLPDEIATQTNRQHPYQQFPQQPAANTMPHVPFQGIPTNPKPTMLQDEDSRQSSMSEGLMNAINVNHFAYAGNGGFSGVPSARQAPQPPIPSPPRQEPTGRQYYSLVPGSDQPQLLHDYRPASAEDEVDPVTGKIRAMPTGVSGGKIYVCMGYGECAKTFTRSEHLARHIRKHTGERPFACHCGRAFSRLDNLRQHVSSCHAEESAANQRTLASLGEIHAHLSIKALRDQKRAGQVIELGKEPPAKKRKPRSKEPRKPRKALMAVDLISAESEAGPGPSTQNHRAAQISKTETAEYDLAYDPSPVIVSVPPPQVDTSVPVTRLSPGYAIRHQPFGPYGRPWTAGRPESSHMNGHARPGTQNSNPDSRPATNARQYAVPYIPQPVLAVDEHASHERHMSQQYVDPAMNGSHGEVHAVEREDAYRLPYGYPEPVQRVMNGQMQYARSRYEPVPLRNEAGYDMSAPPTPQGMQQGGVPVYSSSGPSYTSSGSLNSRHSRRSGISSGGQPPYLEHHMQQQFRSIAPASSSQIAEIYGNSVGQQESPFSYHPPPTATTGHPPQFAPVYYQGEGEEVYMPQVQQPQQQHQHHQHQQQHHHHQESYQEQTRHHQPEPQEMSHYIMGARNQRRRPSLPIQQLLETDPNHQVAQPAAPQEAVYYVPYANGEGYSNGESFPAEMPPAGYNFNVIPGYPAEPSAPSNARQEWNQPPREDPLVGQMDAKARALLEGNGTYGMS